VFGQYEQDDITVAAGDGEGSAFVVHWQPESHGKPELCWRWMDPDQVGRELFRLGVPDKVCAIGARVPPILISDRRGVQTWLPA
jgi:hypothetical protein